MCKQRILGSNDSSQIISRISNGRLENVMCGFGSGAVVETGSMVREALGSSEEFMVPISLGARIGFLIL
jgi:hypothetical protein